MVSSTASDQAGGAGEKPSAKLKLPFDPQRGGGGGRAISAPIGVVMGGLTPVWKSNGDPAAMVYVRT